ncbi:MAG TPA: hypothetical protein VFQ07_07755 [Candidatus Polarisedimenticolia bacterium]|nr:hypothetical protein [Candidatus Polarisedimenticolia bacterium]
MPAPRRILAWRLAAAALGLLVIALSFTPITNNDLFLHLLTGRLVLERHAVPTVDDYSALARGRPYVAHEWLSAVLFRLIQAAGPGEGFDRLVVAKVALSLLLAWLLLRAARHAGASRAVALPCLAWVMCLAAARIQERPHLFAYVLLASFLLVLARRAQRQRTGRGDRGLWLLPFLQVVWTNAHGSFLLGPALVGFAAIGSVLDRYVAPRSRRGTSGAAREPATLAALAAGLGLVCLVNPYGVQLLKFPFALTGSRFMEQIYEWLPPYAEAFRTSYMARYYVVWALGSLTAWVLALRQPRRWPSGAGFHLLVFGTFLALSLRMNRSVTDFALATLPGTSFLVTTLLARRAAAPGRPASAAVPAGLAVLFMAAAAWFSFAGYAYNAATVRRPGSGLGPGVPVAAADYVARRHLDGACFNTYSAGAYLAWRFYPGLRVGMDSRNDVYGEDLYADYERALREPAALAAMLERLHASFVFVEWAEPGMVTTGQTIRALAPPWRPVYFDDGAVVYAAEQGERADLVRDDGYTTLDPMLFRPGQWSPQEARDALAETERARRTGGDPLIARVMRIEALRTLGDRTEAEREEEALVRLDPPLYHIWILMGLSHLERGEGPAAVERLTQALRLNPRSTAAATALQQARRLGG